MTEYSIVHSELKKYGNKGCSLKQLLQDTQLTQPAVMEVIRKGFKTGAFEAWEQNEVRIYRVRPDRRNITRNRY